MKGKTTQFAQQNVGQERALIRLFADGTALTVQEMAFLKDNGYIRTCTAVGAGSQRAYELTSKGANLL